MSIDWLFDSLLVAPLDINGVDRGSILQILVRSIESIVFTYCIHRNGNYVCCMYVHVCVRVVKCA